jgi:uncharacterized surface protein with fasciclin (FAS1) repeats
MKRTVRLLSLLVATLLILAGCATAEEAGDEATETEADTAGLAVETETEVVVEEETTEPAVTTETETEAEVGAAGDTQQDILELASENPQLSQLVAALEAAGLTDALQQAGPLTVFAPNNEAFAALDQADLTALLADPAQLGDVLQFHVVEGSFTAADLSDGDTLPTLAGEDLEVSVQGETVMVGDAEVVQADIQAGNGVIHVIDAVLMP